MLCHIIHKVNYRHTVACLWSGQGHSEVVVLKQQCDLTVWSICLWTFTILSKILEKSGINSKCCSIKTPKYQNFPLYWQLNWETKYWTLPVNQCDLNYNVKCGVINSLVWPSPHAVFPLKKTAHFFSAQYSVNAKRKMHWNKMLSQCKK